MAIKQSSNGPYIVYPGALGPGDPGFDSGNLPSSWGVTGSSSGTVFPSGTDYLSLTDNIPALISEWNKIFKDKSADANETEEWKELEVAYYKHLMWRYSCAKIAFIQQTIVAWLITILVLGLVGCGLWLSWYQLKQAILLGNISGLQTEIAVETAGRLSASSSIVGVLVLLISLGFFFLFIHYVFRPWIKVPALMKLTENRVDTSEKNKKEDGA